jgi:hypothetical protein
MARRRKVAFVVSVVVVISLVPAVAAVIRAASYRPGHAQEEPVVAGGYAATTVR